MFIDEVWKALSIGQFSETQRVVVDEKIVIKDLAIFVVEMAAGCERGIGRMYGWSFYCLE